MTGWDQHLAPLLDARYPALLAYARVLTAGDQGAAEDLVHDAVVRTFARGRGFADIHHAENYVRKAMTSALVDGYRRNARTIKAFARVAERTNGPSPEVSIVPATDIERALALLSARERACVVLRHYDDLTIAGIAARLGLAEGSVKRYLSDASAKLAAALGDSGIDANDSGHHGHLVPVTSTGEQP